MTSNNWIQSLRCLRCEASDLQWRNARDFDGERLPTDGALVCGNCGARYPIADRILDMHARDAALTLAGRSNQAPLTPFVYERMWRPRSLPILSGGRLSARAELQLLREWAPLQAHHLALDLGSATGLYARTLAAMDASATVVALDLAPNMLRASHLYARRAGVRNIAHLRAAADRLPFATTSVNLVVCGGSLNEFASMRTALAEAQRVLADDGMMFTMSLGSASSRSGSLAQRAAHTSGIQFPSLDDFNRLVSAAGLAIARQQSFGVVTFSLMTKTPALAQHTAPVARYSSEVQAA